MLSHTLTQPSQWSSCGTEPNCLPSCSQKAPLRDRLAPSMGTTVPQQLASLPTGERENASTVCSSPRSLKKNSQYWLHTRHYSNMDEYPPNSKTIFYWISDKNNGIKSRLRRGKAEGSRFLSAVLASSFNFYWILPKSERRSNVMIILVELKFWRSLPRARTIQVNLYYHCYSRIQKTNGCQNMWETNLHNISQKTYGLFCRLWHKLTMYDWVLRTDFVDINSKHILGILIQKHVW